MAYQSKLVQYELCPKLVRARGVAGHMLMAHQIVVERKTPVRPKADPPADNSGSNSSQDSGYKPNQLSNPSPKLRSTVKADLGAGAKPKKSTAVDNKISVTVKPAWFSIVEAEANNKPSFGYWVKYYRRDPDMAGKAWERIAELEKNYLWPCIVNPERYRALRRVLFGAVG